MAVFVRKPWTRQPQDRATPINGVRLIATPSQFAGAKTAITGAALSSGNLGRAWAFSSNSQYVTVSNFTNWTTGGFEIVIYARRDAAAANGQTLFQILGTSGLNNRIEIYGITSGAIRADIFSPTGSPSTVDTTTAVTQGRDFVYVLRAIGGVYSAYLDNALSGQTTGTLPNDTASSYTLGGRTSNTEGFPGLIYGHAITRPGLIEPAALAQRPWSLFEPRRIFVPVAAAGGASFASTGALSASAATVAGTATHKTLHAATGALAADAATVAGSAVSPHLSTGELAAGAATVAGTAAHLTLHPSTGALSAAAATISGAATRYITHTSTGALSADAATVAGSASYSAGGAFAATGALTAQDASVAGTAARLAAHAGTGAVAAGPATVAGTATRLALHTSTGALAAGDATMAGVAIHTGTHAATGALVADSATMTGAAILTPFGSTTISTMPPYITVWMWKRTA